MGGRSRTPCAPRQARAFPPCLFHPGFACLTAPAASSRWEPPASFRQSEIHTRQTPPGGAARSPPPTPPPLPPPRQPVRPPHRLPRPPLLHRREHQIKLMPRHPLERLVLYRRDGLSSFRS